MLSFFEDIGKDARKHAATALAAAFAFVMALSWNDAIQGIVQKIVEYLGLVGEKYIIQLAAAIIATIICLIGIIAASRIVGKQKR